MLAFLFIFRQFFKAVANGDYQSRYIRPCEWRNATPTEHIFVKFCVWDFYQNLWTRGFWWKSDIQNTAREDPLSLRWLVFLRLYSLWVRNCGRWSWSIVNLGVREVSARYKISLGSRDIDCVRYINVLLWCAENLHSDVWVVESYSNGKHIVSVFISNNQQI
jgi:hypothetical protein